MPEDKLKFLGDRIRSARKDCGLTQQALADQADLAVKTIQDVERGRKNTTYETLCQLIERLGISPNSLFPSQMSPEDEAIQRFIGKFLGLAILQTRRSSSVHWIFWLKNCWLVNIHLNQTVPSEPADKKFLFLLVFILSLKNGRKFFRYSIGKIILMSCSTKFFLHRKSQQVKDFTHWLFYINGYLNQENRALLQHINRHCFVFDIQPVRSSKHPEKLLQTCSDFHTRPGWRFPLWLPVSAGAE